MPARKILTLHAPLSKTTATAVMELTQQTLDRWGFRWWVTHEPNAIVLMADVPAVWHRRGPTDAELKHFQRLWDAGRVDDARAFAQEGFR